MKLKKHGINCETAQAILYLTKGHPRYRIAGIDRDARDDRQSH
jgi:hypothetical protein